MFPLEDILPGQSEVAVIGMLATAPLDLLVQFAYELNERYPDAQLVIICQKGRREKLEPLFAKGRVVEALPKGMFGYAGLLHVDYRGITRVGTDLLIVPYNNPTGTGYSALRIAMRWIGATSCIGVDIGRHLTDPHQWSAHAMSWGRLVRGTIREIAVLSLMIPFVTYAVIEALLSINSRKHRWRDHPN